MTNATPAARTSPIPTEAAPAPPAESAAPLPTLLDALRRSGRPLLLTVRRKKRRRYTRGLGGLQKDLESRARANSRLLSALAAGSEKYESRARSSARKKRDGALRDHWKNSAAGLRTTVRKASKAIRSREVRDVVIQAIAQAVVAPKKF